MIKKYFCDACGARFTAAPVVVAVDIIRDPLCPACGCACVYEDSDAGKRESVAALTEYENKVEIELDEK